MEDLFEFFMNQPLVQTSDEEIVMLQLANTVAMSRVEDVIASVVEASYETLYVELKSNNKTEYVFIDRKTLKWRLED